MNVGCNAFKKALLERFRLIYLAHIKILKMVRTHSVPDLEKLLFFRLLFSGRDIYEEV